MYRSMSFPFQNLKFNLDFIPDSEIQKHLHNTFDNVSVPYLPVSITLSQMQTMIDLKREYYNSLYRTTLYDYNPIENYNRKETRTENLNSTQGLTSSTRDTVHGFTDSTATDSSGQSDTNTDSVMSISSIISGNVGVMSTQEMIQKERDILISITEQFVEEFKKFFNWDIYGGYSIYDN